MNLILIYLLNLHLHLAVVENPILSRYLSEARKYNLSLILAGQYVFKSLKSDKKKSMTLIGKVYFNFFIKAFLYSKSTNFI